MGRQALPRSAMLAGAKGEGKGGREEKVAEGLRKREQQLTASTNVFPSSLIFFSFYNVQCTRKRRIKVRGGAERLLRQAHADEERKTSLSWGEARRSAGCTFLSTVALRRLLSSRAVRHRARRLHGRCRGSFSAQAEACRRRPRARPSRDDMSQAPETLRQHETDNAQQAPPIADAGKGWLGCYAHRMERLLRQ